MLQWTLDAAVVVLNTWADPNVVWRWLTAQIENVLEFMHFTMGRKKMFNWSTSSGATIKIDFYVISLLIFQFVMNNSSWIFLSLKFLLFSVRAPIPMPNVHSRSYAIWPYFEYDRILDDDASSDEKIMAYEMWRLCLCKWRTFNAESVACNYTARSVLHSCGCENIYIRFRIRTGETEKRPSRFCVAREERWAGPIWFNTLSYAPIAGNTGKPFTKTQHSVSLFKVVEWAKTISKRKNPA